MIPPITVFPCFWPAFAPFEFPPVLPPMMSCIRADVSVAPLSIGLAFSESISGRFAATHGMTGVNAYITPHSLSADGMFSNCCGVARSFELSKVDPSNGRDRCELSKLARVDSSIATYNST